MAEDTHDQYTRIHHLQQKTWYSSISMLCSLSNNVQNFQSTGFPFVIQWPLVMVHARSCSFRRTIIGWLRQSLRWWPTHHCSVPPLPPATLVRLILELHRNTSSTLIPPTKPAFLSLSLPTSTMCYLPQHNQSPTMLHTCSMFQANHIAHTPVLEVMGLGHHKDLWGFQSASFGTLRNTSRFIICSFYYHMLSK